MAVTLTVLKNHKIGGKTFQESRSIEADGVILHEESIPAAEAGSLTTRTGNDAGIVTVDDSTHGITLADTVDVYWTAGCRRGMSVTNVAVNAITVSGGSGDNFPTQDTEVTIAIQREMDIVVTGTNVKGILFYTAKRGQFVLENAGGEELYKEVKATQTWEWFSGSGETNPIAGNSIIVAKVTHGDTGAAQMRVAVAYDND